MERGKKTSFYAYVAELHRAVHAIGLYLDNELAGEISQAEALAVLHVAHRPGCTINELHHAFLHRRSTLTSVLDRLEKKKLVHRASAPGDRRSVALTLTARGSHLATAITKALGRLASENNASPTIAERDVARVRGVAETASLLARVD